MNDLHRIVQRGGRLTALLPAAGVGSRVGGQRPKQYLNVNGQPLLAQTVNRLRGCDAIGRIVVALAADDPHFADLKLDGVSCVTGGDSRAASVLALLDALGGGAKDEWVLVHDAARPCVRSDDVLKLIQVVADTDCAGGILATRVRETVKAASVDGTVAATVARDALWLAGTPQLFQAGALRDALRSALAAGVAVTDEASAMEWAGHAVVLVEGHDDNIKVTRSGDLALAASILVSQRLTLRETE